MSGRGIFRVDSGHRGGRLDANIVVVTFGDGRELLPAFAGTPTGGGGAVLLGEYRLPGDTLPRFERHRSVVAGLAFRLMDHGGGHDVRVHAPSPESIPSGSWLLANGLVSVSAPGFGSAALKLVGPGE